jgi:hypothetical protein
MLQSPKRWVQTTRCSHHATQKRLVYDNTMPAEQTKVFFERSEKRQGGLNFQVQHHGQCLAESA